MRWWLLRNVETEADLAKFQARLWQPPKGQEAAKGSPWDPEKENAALAALSAGLSGSPAKTVG